MSRIIFGQVGKLKADRIEEYEKLHANPWKEVLDTIRDCNLKNYSIFRKGELVFAYFEYTGSDYGADMAKMEADPVTQEWWKHTKPCFEKFAMDDSDEFYSDMKQIFYFE